MSDTMIYGQPLISKLISLQVWVSVRLISTILLARKLIFDRFTSCPSQNVSPILSTCTFTLSDTTSHTASYRVANFLDIVVQDKPILVTWLGCAVSPLVLHISSDTQKTHPFSQAAVDSIIAVAMCLHLRSKRTGFKQCVGSKRPGTNLP